MFMYCCLESEWLDEDCARMRRLWSFRIQAAIFPSIGSLVMRMRVEIKALLMEVMMMTIMKICADCGKGSTTLVTAFYHFYHLNVIMMSMMVTITNHCKFKSLNCLYFFKSCSPQIPEDWWVCANFFSTSWPSVIAVGSLMSLNPSFLFARLVSNFLH